MGHCLFMRKGETHTAPVNYKANFADNTWEQIIDACQKNAVPDTWLVGDQKNMTINGTVYAIDIIGKNHDVYSDGSGNAPLTFQMHDCYNTTQQMNSAQTSSGGWKNCNMRTTHLPDIMAIMPSNVNEAIREVNKKTSAGAKSSTIVTTADKLFLLSEIEVLGSIPYSYAGEGSQYEYYAAGNSAAKRVNGELYRWWERSPSNEGSIYFCRIDGSGASTGNGANFYLGVSFAFCF